jgi:2-hydroxychromene-2-carboxylate isomerase
MGTSKAHALPPRLQAARRRFQHWRRTRKVGSRIPRPLWANAVKLAESYGIHPTAKALGLDYNSLKKRLESASQSAVPASAKAATFVELAAPAGRGMPECILELEDVEGAKMRLHFKGIEAPDLAALSRSLWGVE